MAESHPLTPRANGAADRVVLSFSPDFQGYNVDPEATPTLQGLKHEHTAGMITSTMSKRTPFDIPVSPLANARMSAYATTVTVARHSSSSVVLPYSDYSPYSSSPSTAINSRPPSPTKEFDDEEPSIPDHDRLKWRLASGFFAAFMGGWADGVTGTVMPYLTSQFNLTSTLSSSLFAGTTCGFFAGTLLVELMMKTLGCFQVHRNQRSFFPFFPVFSRKRVSAEDFGHSDSQARFLVLVIASTIHASYFILMGSRSGYPVMFLAYVLSAFSRALLTAPLNAFFADGPKQALGYGLGLASLGSVISPLVCQSIIATGVPWYRFYYGSLILSGFNILFLAVTFKVTPTEVFRDHQKALNDARRRKNLYLLSGHSSPVDKVDSSEISTVKLDVMVKPRSALRFALTMPYQWALSFFILLYCGSETLTQGFMVTYLLSTRNANPNSIGYVTSGFWGGISIGRFVWGYCFPILSFTQRKHAVHACIGLAVGLHLTIWLVKSNVENAVATSLIGVLYGPIFPACLSMANDILPAEVHMIAMALISSFASLGGAIFPLLAGAIFDAKGIKTLTYITVPLAAAMALLWTLFPSRLPTRPVKRQTSFFRRKISL